MTFSQLLKHLKRADEFLITPRLETWLLRNPDWTLSEANAERLKQMVMSNPTADRSGYFGASSRGSCKRAQIFSYLGIPAIGRIDTTLTNIFADGRWRHLRWQFMLLEAGIIDDIEVAFFIPELRLRTRFDGKNTKEGWGFELKGHGYIGTIINEGVSIPHALQIHTMFLADLSAEKFSYIAEDKRGNDWREVVIHRDRNVMAAVRRELYELNQCVEDKKLPPVLEECRNGKGPTFRKCPFSYTCLKLHEWPRPEEITPGQPVYRRRKLPHHRDREPELGGWSNTSVQIGKGHSQPKRDAGGGK